MSEKMRPTLPPERANLKGLREVFPVLAKFDTQEMGRPSVSGTGHLKRRAENFKTITATIGLDFRVVLDRSFEGLMAGNESLTEEIVNSRRNEAMDLANHYLAVKADIEPEKRAKFDKLCSILGVEEPKKEPKVTKVIENKPKQEEPKLELNIYAPSEAPDPLYLRISNPRKYTGLVINSKETPLYKRVSMDRAASHALAFEIQKAQKRS